MARGIRLLVLVAIGLSAAEAESTSEASVEYSLKGRFPVMRYRVFHESKAPAATSSYSHGHEQAWVRPVAKPSKAPGLYIPRIRIIVQAVGEPAEGWRDRWLEIREICRRRCLSSLREQLKVEPERLQSVVFRAKSRESLQSTLARALQTMKPSLTPGLVLVVGGPYGGTTKIPSSIVKTARKVGVSVACLWLDHSPDRIPVSMRQLARATGGSAVPVDLGDRTANAEINSTASNEAIGDRVGQAALGATGDWAGYIVRTNALIDWTTTDFGFSDQRRHAFTVKWAEHDVVCHLQCRVTREVLVNAIRRSSARYRVFLGNLSVKELARYGEQLATEPGVRRTGGRYFDQEVTRRVNLELGTGSFESALVLARQVLDGRTRNAVLTRVASAALREALDQRDRARFDRILATVPKKVRAHPDLAGLIEERRDLEFTVRVEELGSAEASPEVVRELRSLRESAPKPRLQKAAEDALSKKAIEVVRSASDGKENAEALRRAKEYQGFLTSTARLELERLVRAWTLQRLTYFGESGQDGRFLLLFDELEREGQSLKRYRVTRCKALSRTGEHGRAEQLAWELVQEAGFDSAEEELWDQVCESAIQKYRREGPGPALKFALHAATRLEAVDRAKPRYQRLLKLATELANEPYARVAEKWLHEHGELPRTLAEQFDAQFRGLEPVTAMTTLEQILMNEPAESAKWPILWTRFHAVTELRSAEMVLNALETFADEVDAGCVERACAVWRENGRTADVLRGEEVPATPRPYGGRGARLEGDVLRVEAWLAHGDDHTGTVVLTTRLPGRHDRPRGLAIAMARFQRSQGDARQGAWRSLEEYSLRRVRVHMRDVGRVFTRLCFDQRPSVVEARLRKGVPRVFGSYLPRYVLWVPRGQMEPDVLFPAQHGLPDWLLLDRVGNAGRGEGQRTCGSKSSSFDEFMCAVVAERYSDRIGIARIGFELLSVK